MILSAIVIALVVIVAFSIAKYATNTRADTTRIQTDHQDQPVRLADSG